MQIVNHTLGCLGTVVAFPAPYLADGTAHAVSQIVESTAAIQMSVGNSLYQGAVNIGVGGLLG